MKPSKRWVALICLMVLAVPLLSRAEILLAPSLEVQYRPPEGETLRFDLMLTKETNGQWLWLQIPSDVPLESLSLAFFPEEMGVLRIYAPDDGRLTFEAPLPIHAEMLDLTESEERPFSFVVSGWEDETTALWTGWLTVSHRIRPVDLPPMPPFSPIITEPPLTQAPVTEPPETQAPVTQPPAPSPFTMPPNTPSPATQSPPVQRTGYAAVTGSNVGLLDMPGGSVRSVLQWNDVLYVNGQQVDPLGGIWYAVTAMDTSMPGFVHAAYLRFMTPQEVQDYLNRPTPRPTVSPTRAPVADGYARVTWQTTSLRNWPSTGASLLRTLLAGDVVYVTGLVTDGDGTAWYAAQARDAYGYLMASSVRMMTLEEVLAYLESQAVPTPLPTARPTLNPNYTYAIVGRDDVNFRLSPSGAALQRLARGTIVRVLSGPSSQDGFAWFRVQLGEESGYLRADMLSFLSIEGMPSPTPTPTPLPTARPLGLLDRLQASLDACRYRRYVRGRAEVLSYAVADLDSDARAELLIVSERAMADGSPALHLAAYRKEGEHLTRLATRLEPLILKAGASISLLIVHQSGREALWIRQKDGDGALLRETSITLTDAGWVSLPIPSFSGTLSPFLEGLVTDAGEILYADHSGLDAEAAQEQARQRESQGAVLRVLWDLLMEEEPPAAVEGNG